MVYPRMAIVSRDVDTTRSFKQCRRTRLLNDAPRGDDARAGGGAGVIAQRNAGQGCPAKRIPGAGRVNLERGRRWRVAGSPLGDRPSAALGPSDECGTPSQSRIPDGIAWLNIAEHSTRFVLIHKEVVSRGEQSAHRGGLSLGDSAIGAYRKRAAATRSASGGESGLARG